MIKTIAYYTEVKAVESFVLHAPGTFPIRKGTSLSLIDKLTFLDWIRPLPLLILSELQFPKNYSKIWWFGTFPIFWVSKKFKVLNPLLPPPTISVPKINLSYNFGPHLPTSVPTKNLHYSFSVSFKNSKLWEFRTPPFQFPKNDCDNFVLYPLES